MEETWEGRKGKGKSCNYILIKAYFKIDKNLKDKNLKFNLRKERVS